MLEILDYLKTNWKWASGAFCLLVGTGVLLFSEQLELGVAFLLASGLPFTFPPEYKKGKTLAQTRKEWEEM